MSANVAKMVRSANYGKLDNAAITEVVQDTYRTIANTRAMLFRLDPTPERLTAWADAYAMLPEGQA